MRRFVFWPHRKSYSGPVLLCLLFCGGSDKKFMSQLFEESGTDGLSIKILHIVTAVLPAGSILAELEISSRLAHLVL